MATLRALGRLLQPKEKRLAVLLLLFGAFAALLEAAALASTLPFFRLLLVPRPLVPEGLRDVVFPLFSIVGRRPRVAMGLMVLALVLLSNISSFAVVRLQMKFVYFIGHRLSLRLVATFLASPYERVVVSDHSRAARHILHESDQLIQGVMRPITHIAASGMVVLALFAVVAAVLPVGSLAVIIGLAAAYGAIFIAVRRGVHDAGARRTAANDRRFKIAGDALGGVKDIKVAQTAVTFLDRYGAASDEYARVTARQQSLQLTPRFVVDTLAVGGMVGTAVVMASANRNVAVLLPSLGLLVFAGYRALPHFQHLVANAIQLGFHRPILEEIADELANEPHAPGVRPAPLTLTDGIRLEHVTVAYRGRARPAIRDVTISVPRGASVALVGKTGAGKSTIADVFLGLVRPTTGALVVDGRDIVGENVASWQTSIGYVPQRIYLADDTIRNNVAFGVPSSLVDERRLAQALCVAQMDDFIAHLPEGYDTVVGERGVRLSGGQQQRIGIARALYRSRNVLVLDEATSDLDSVTQAAIVASIRELPERPTILLIAHRLESIKGCDIIYVVDDGRVIGQGSYAELEVALPEFRALASAKAQISTTE